MTSTHTCKKKIPGRRLTEAYRDLGVNITLVAIKYFTRSSLAIVTNLLNTICSEKAAFVDTYLVKAIIMTQISSLR